MGKRSSNTGEEAYKLHLKGYPNTKIATILKKAESTISEALTEFKQRDSFQLGQLSVVTFLEWFEKAAQFFNLQNSEYEEMITQVNNLKIDNKLDAADKLRFALAKIEGARRLKESQDKNMERIIYLAKDGEVVLAIKLMKDMLVTMPKQRKELKLVSTSDSNEKEQSNSTTKTKVRKISRKKA